MGGILSGARVSLVITLRPREAGTESSDPPPAAPNRGRPSTEPTAEVPLADQEPASASDGERA